MQGIRYAADPGAVAVASSMGPTLHSEEFRAAIDYAWARGTIFVDVHPERMPREDGKLRACGAGEGDPRILHAGIVSVPEHPATPDPARDLYVWPYDLEPHFEDGWGYSNGPPTVAGAIALVKAANPALTPAEIKALLVETASVRDGAPGTVAMTPIPPGSRGPLAGDHPGDGARTAVEITSTFPLIAPSIRPSPFTVGDLPRLLVAGRAARAACRACARHRRAPESTWASFDRLWRSRAGPSPMAGRLNEE